MNGQKGSSYLSVIISVVVIQVISLVFISTVALSNNSNDLSNKNILSAHIGESFLELSEANILNLNIFNQESIDIVYQKIKYEIDSFNVENSNFDIELYFQCDNKCNNINNPDLQTFDRTYEDNEIEVSILVTFETSNSDGTKDEMANLLTRMVVVQ